jgi:hypothetical protein
MFDQLLTRSENCQKRIDSLISLSPSQSYYHKVVMPKAEILMLQEALRCENEANLEDMLGHLSRYVYLLTSVAVHFLTFFSFYFF